MLQKAIIAFPFFLFGTILKQINFKNVHLNNTLLSIITFITTTTLVVIVMINGKVDLYDGYLGNSVLGYYAGGIIGTILIISLSSILVNLSLIPSFIINISNGTLVIMGLHTMIVPFLDSITRHRELFHNDGIFKALIAILLIYFPMKFIENRMPFLIGKYSKSKTNV